MSSPPFKVKAIYEYTSPHEDDLHFPNGQIITVTEEEDDDWYSGEYVDASGVKQEGIFPKNFVEKYEPTAPPRPTRTSRPKKEVEPEPVPESPVVHEEPIREPEPIRTPAPEVAQEEAAPPPAQEPEVVAPPPAAVPKDVEPAAPPPKAIPKPAPAPAAAPSKPSSPPPVSDKPSGNSFRDRIAAFNKAAAPPVAPFKPSGLGAGGSGFIKKPFVAPPPSKDAYIPPPREPVPQRIYRREEDPEIAARESENQEQAERAGLAPTGNEEEDQPKPTSLKERIALLQKQQAEQASRHADAAAKKEKPKRPVKKRTESQEPAERREEEGAPLEKLESTDTITRGSFDSSRNGEAAHHPQRRRSSKGTSAQPAINEDGNDADMSGAGETTEEAEDLSTVERDDEDEKPRSRAGPPAAPSRAPAAPIREPDVGEEEGVTDEPGEEEEGEVEGEEEEEEEEEEIDPEVRRKEEIRARMAKMSGGMGMHGMFGPPGGMPMPGIGAPAKKKKPSAPSEKQASGDSEEPVMRAPPVPIMALPGMSRVRSPEEVHKPLEVERELETAEPSISSSRNPQEVVDVEDIKPPRSSHSDHSTTLPSRSAAPPVPGGRPAPPPVPTEARPLAPPPQIPMSPSAGSESDDEPHGARKLSLQMPDASAQTGRAPPPPPPAGAPSVPGRHNDGPISPISTNSKRLSYVSTDSPRSPVMPGNERRGSRVPPIPMGNPLAGSRAPPPPPPHDDMLRRSSTADVRPAPEPPHEEPQESEEEEDVEYEGDYDTDIASAVPHKDALKSHARDSSLEDSTPIRSPVISPSGAPPPLPPLAAPRAVPPPLPSQPPPPSRQSIDMPRAPPSRQSVDMPRAAPPPPPPPAKEPVYDNEDDEEYDPYKYTAPAPVAPAPVAPAPVAPAPSSRPPTAPSRQIPEDDEDIYGVSPVMTRAPPQDRPAPPPPPHDDQIPASPPRVPTSGSGTGSASAARSRGSIDVQRTLGAGMGSSRRSTELGRMSMDTGYMANDVDLAKATKWWAQPKGIPPAFEARRDILHELDDSNDGSGLVTKQLFVLFQDYSQTIITVQFNPNNPTEANIEQRHEPPPSRLRQDQLEQAHERYGRRIAEEVMKKKDTVVAPGTPDALVAELLRPLKDALPPVGGRSYGALIYGNLANASTQQNDEIRPGDIITLRNTKFQGKHGPMHAKYSVEVGKGDGHVGVVAEWDGTKKKVRAWEQGRESKKVKLESFKLDDLRSGEVKIWRVMPRSWVGWEGVN